MKTLSETPWRNASCISPFTPLRATLVAPGNYGMLAAHQKEDGIALGQEQCLGRIWHLIPPKAVTIGLGRATREPFESNHYVCLWAAAQLRHLSASNKCMIAIPFSKSSGPGKWLIRKECLYINGSRCKHDETDVIWSIELIIFTNSRL